MNRCCSSCSIFKPKFTTNFLTLTGLLPIIIGHWSLVIGHWSAVNSSTQLQATF
ncbi:hypothetical protein [Coleofasciculus sp. F4-SAH-05]|uniref:hypothetical protein n=1 Tax=Coleofasciculus sp. F4-SAH-05 TaxID=3069525 RepID=UPI00330236DE